MNKQISKDVIGHFVIMGEEEIDQIKKAKVLNAGRSGIYYEKSTLINTLKNNPALKGKEMHIVEILVPNHAISSTNQNKFGIRNGKNIPIIKIQPFIHEKELEVA